MPITTCRAVLWVSLLIVMPLPFYLGQWGWVPVGHVIQALFGGGEGISGASVTELALLIVQLLIGAGVCWGLARAFGVLSIQWPDKIRGSIMGLVVLSALIVFSSIEVYRPIMSQSPAHKTFLQVYESR